jgi:hypothetical protein
MLYIIALAISSNKHFVSLEELDLLTFCWTLGDAVKREIDTFSEQRKRESDNIKAKFKTFVQTNNFWRAFTPS